VKETSNIAQTFLVFYQLFDWKWKN